MAVRSPVDVSTLRGEIQNKYREVAEKPDGEYHFHTGRNLARRLGYPDEVVDQLPDQCVESFAGVGNPFSVGKPKPGGRVADLGSGAGFDCLVAAHHVGPSGSVTGIDMTAEMLEKARRNARTAQASNVSFREGFMEQLPLPDASVDVVISNGVFNLVPDKEAAFREAFRVLVPGGSLYLADIVVHKAVPDSAKAVVDLWTA